jgi:predicted regulator of Ras-like GTPase activity (Roadblock/LC7/MglB family)
MFKSLLERVPERAGGVLGIALVSLDGIAIEKIQEDPSVNLDSVIAEFTDRMKRSMAASAEMGIGGLTEQVVHSEKAVVILREVHDEYFILCAAKPDGWHGRVRHAIRCLVPDMAQELV